MRHRQPFCFHFTPRHQGVLSTPWGAHTQATFNFPGLAAQDDHVSFKFAFFVKCFRVHHLPIMARFDHVWSCLIINGCRMRIGSHWQVTLQKTMVILPSGALIWANKSRILKWKRWYFCGWSTVLSIIWGEVTLRSPHFTQKLNSKGFKGMYIYIYIWTEGGRERERETSQMHPIPGPLCPIMGVDNGQCLPISNPYLGAPQGDHHWPPWKHYSHIACGKRLHNYGKIHHF